MKEEAEILADILDGLVEGSSVPDDVNIYSPEYHPPDGDVYVQRAAQLLREQITQIDLLTKMVDSKENKDD